MARFSGVIRVNHRARLETEHGSLTLIPYPPDAPIEPVKMESMGRELFAYLKNKQATVLGVRFENKLFYASLAESKLQSTEYKLGPEGHDKFAQQIEEYFHTDSQQIAERLNDAGILTVNAFYHRIKNFEPEVLAFSQYLKVPEDAIKRFLKAIEEDTRNKGLVTAPPRVPVTRGVDLKRVARVAGVAKKKRASAVPPTFPDSAITPKLPSGVDLSGKVTRVKDQGPFRGTCVAHTAAALLEFELIKGGSYNRRLDLSEQYLYWGCKQIDGAVDDHGTFIEYAVEVLKSGVAPKKLEPGVCKEQAWPYDDVSIPGNESQDPPPARAIRAQKYGVSKYNRLNPSSIKELKTALSKNHCVGLSVYTYHFWIDGYAWREGIISLPFRIEPDGAHAICLVGYEDNDASHSDGYFIFKNSWSTKWGAGRSNRGFGSLPYRYVIEEGIEAWTVEL